MALLETLQKNKDIDPSKSQMKNAHHCHAPQHHGIPHQYQKQIFTMVDKSSSLAPFSWLLQLVAHNHNTMQVMPKNWWESIPYLQFHSCCMYHFSIKLLHLGQTHNASYLLTQTVYCPTATPHASHLSLMLTKSGEKLFVFLWFYRFSIFVPTCDLWYHNPQLDFCPADTAAGLCLPKQSWDAKRMIWDHVFTILLFYHSPFSIKLPYIPRPHDRWCLSPQANFCPTSALLPACFYWNRVVMQKEWQDIITL